MATLEEIQTSLVLRRKAFFYQDTSRLHTISTTFQKLEQFEWEIMPHASYSPYIAPSHYNLFCKLENHFERTNTNSLDKVRSVREDYFSSQRSVFYMNGLSKCKIDGTTFAENEGRYILD